MSYQMTLQEARALVDYHYWARDRLLEAVAKLTAEQYTQRIESSFPSIRDTLVHLWAAESVWVARWAGDAPTALPDGRELTDLPALQESWQGWARTALVHPWSIAASTASHERSRSRRCCSTS